MNKKYILTNETKIIRGRTLYRIKALIDFNDVKKGDLGGFVESEKNLSHDGHCWVYNRAYVYDDAKVYENAKIKDIVEVCGHAEIYDNAEVTHNSRVYGHAKVYDNAKIFNDAEVYDNAKIFGNARVYGFSQVFDFAKIYGNTFVFENAKVYGNAEVYDNAEIYGESEVCGNAKLYEKLHIQYGILKTDLLKEKNIELILAYYDKHIKVNDNKIILYKKVYKTRNKNINILTLYNGNLIFERNKNIMKFNYSLIGCKSQNKNHPTSDYFAKIQINLEDIKCINLYYLTCSKFKILNIVKGGA